MVNGQISENRVGRNSNLELLRIIAMFLIVAHHYVVNSGITALYDFGNVNANMLFLQLWGMWGKTAINVFVLITGYFMCASRLTVKRYLKMFLEAKFYRIIIFVIFALCGLEIISFGSVFQVLFSTLTGANSAFTASFLIFYLFIPFYNLLIQNLDKKRHGILVGLMLFVFSVTATFFFNSAIFSYIGWYVVLYFTAAYIRLYPPKWTENTALCGVLLLVSAAGCMASVAGLSLFADRIGINNIYFFVQDSNKLPAFAVGLLAFLFFKNVKIGQSKAVNTISSTTFGVLCIHASSGAMLKLLWGDLLKVTSYYDAKFYVLVLHAVISCVLVFVVCSVIDLMRQYAVEKPFFRWFDKRFGNN